MAVRIGELAKKSGLATSALRYYEAAGLLPAAERTPAGYRMYGEAAVGRLQFIQRAQALGLTLREIQQLLEEDGEPERLRHVVAHKLAEAERRLSEVAALKADLESMYVRLLRSPAPACGHVGDCGCWLPTEEEVNAMTAEVRSVCECGGDCDCGSDCGCGGDCC